MEVVSFVHDQPMLSPPHPTEVIKSASISEHVLLIRNEMVQDLLLWGEQLQNLVDYSKYQGKLLPKCLRKFFHSFWQ